MVHPVSGTRFHVDRDPRSLAADAPGSAPAAWVTLAYMVAALPVLAPGWTTSDPRYLLVASGHISLVAALLLALRRKGVMARAAQAWLPLAAIPLLYAELPYLIATVGARFGDEIVQRWEVAVWSGQPARTLAGAAPWTLLSEALHLAYLSYYALIYVPLGWLWWRAAQERPTRAFSEAALGVVATFVACFAIFVMFPVQGPRYLWPAPEGIPDGPMRATVRAILERGSSRGAAFPSSHMAVAFVQALMAFRWRVPGRLLIAALTAGLGAGAVYGGFHYAVDMAAGAVLGGTVFLAVRWWGNHHRVTSE